VSTKGKLLDEFKLFYEELVTPANKPAQTRIRRVRLFLCISTAFVNFSTGIFYSVVSIC
jgi:hypothetical protein